MASRSITANKELLANVGAELYAAADAAGCDLLFEAAVAGGIPIVRALRESLHGEPITGCSASSTAPRTSSSPR
jgi:homoserine dehydrogenase